MNIKRISIIFVFAFLFLSAADLLSTHPLTGQFFADEAKLPRSFRISRAKSSTYYAIKTVYNPVEDIYVSFISEFDNKTYNVTIYSRQYNKKGKPISPFFKVLPISLKRADSDAAFNFVSHPDVCFNSTNNKFLFIWTLAFFEDEIYGIELNGLGTRQGVTSRIFTLKKEIGVPYSGLVPKIVWMAGKKQYAMGWLYLHHLQGGDISSKSGYYLSTITSSLSTKKTMKKVRSLRYIKTSYILSDFLAVGDKLVWCTGEDVDANYSVPMVWITNNKGKILNLSGNSGAGMIYPGKKVKYLSRVHAAYDPGSDLFLITWNAAESNEYSGSEFQENYFRIMNSKGKFVGKEKKVLLVEPYQGPVQVTFDQTDNHFFLVCAEYKVLYEKSLVSKPAAPDSKSYWGGRLWGYKIDLRGKQIGFRIPLTKVFSDVDTGLHIARAIYNASDDQHFITYDLYDNVTYKRKAFGLIYE